MNPRPRAGVFSTSIVAAAFAGTFPCPAIADDDRFEPQQVVVNLLPGYAIEDLNQRWGTITLDSYPAGDLYLLGFADSTSPDELDDLFEEDPAVVWAEPNYIQETPEGIRQMVISATGGDWELYADQSATQRIGMPEAHEVTRGAGTLVAVLDTGVDLDHPAFAGRLAPDGYDFVDGDSIPADEANGLDDDGDGRADDGWGHGSMVAGIVALVAPEAAILPIRVLDDEGRGDVFDIVKAVRYAQLHGADIINMSFGIPIQIDALDEIIDSLDSLDVVVVAGAGNENREEPPYYPAAQGKVFMVAALDSLDIKASFSDYHGNVVVSAPGVTIRSAFPENSWAMGDGCSFATPFVTGMAALIESLWPGLTVDEMRDRIRQAVQDVDAIPENEPYEGLLGSGRIYLPLAVAAAASSVSEPERDSASRVLAYPNPAGGAVVLRADAAVSSALRASIFDAGGHLIAVVRSAPAAGDVSLTWNGRDARGELVPPGVYFASVVEGTREIARGRFVIAR